MKRTFDFELLIQEKLYIVREMCIKNPKAVKIILKNPKKVCCPFPNCCKDFPCKDLICNADVCSNGYAYRDD